MFAVREKVGLVAVVGVQKLTNLYYGRHFYVYDLSVTEGARSEGHGERLLRYVEGVAREEGCGYVALACGRERDAALRFYEDRMGYERPGYSMRKALTQ
jgi:ribosomal protein S18 acetylase RimI-like enzyme